MRRTIPFFKKIYKYKCGRCGEPTTVTRMSTRAPGQTPKITSETQKTGPASEKGMSTIMPHESKNIKSKVKFDPKLSNIVLDSKTAPAEYNLTLISS